MHRATCFLGDQPDCGMFDCVRGSVPVTFAGDMSLMSPTTLSKRLPTEATLTMVSTVNVTDGTATKTNGMHDKLSSGSLVSCLVSKSINAASTSSFFGVCDLLLPTSRTEITYLRRITFCC